MTQYLVDDSLRPILDDMNYDINLLYVVPCDEARYLILNHLRDKLSLLESVVLEMRQQNGLTPQPVTDRSNITPLTEPAVPRDSTRTENQAVFTLQELSRFNGVGGNPAYVAVNGVVYNVTNNATWAAATHFGLSAGRDLTGEFASCHAGQQILNQLQTVGRLVENE